MPNPNPNSCAEAHVKRPLFASQANATPRAHALWLNCKLRALSLLSSVRQCLLGPHVSALVCSTPHGVFCVPASDFVVARRLAFQGVWEPKKLDFYLSLLRRDDRALVVGAHIGSVAIPFARKAGFVTAIEANPLIFPLLRWNVLLNDLHNISLHNVAAYDRLADLPFLCSSANTGGSKVSPSRANYSFLFDSPQPHIVPACRLDDLITTPHNLILLDIEGAEYSALRGMPRLLANARTLIVEVVPNHLHASAISFDIFLSTIPPHFTTFRSADEPKTLFDRSSLSRYWTTVQSTAYYRGIDLVCETH